jgi:hypothetical protein
VVAKVSASFGAAPSSASDPDEHAATNSAITASAAPLLRVISLVSDVLRNR